MYRWIVGPASAKIVAMELMRDERPRQTEAAPTRKAVKAVEAARPIEAPAPAGRRQWLTRALRLAQ